MNKQTFINELKKIDIDLKEEQLESFNKYKELLQEYNNKFNLTSILEDSSIYLKHFYDSLCIFKIKELSEKSSLLDIGTGAGFPGLPIAIVNPNITVTLVESNKKKCDFLDMIKDTLKLSNVNVINSRAEEFVKNNKNTFDIVTSRAVSHLRVLSELELPALKLNGLFLPLKSNIDEELKESEILIEELGGKIEEIIRYNLPIEDSVRTIIKIRKVAKTPEKYPREYSKIIKDLKKQTK